MKWHFFNPVFEYETSYADLGGPWAGHKYFAYDLVRNQKPKKIVELGTHLGCSLFSFSQAIKDAKLKTEIDAIDTWKGDEHTGFYPEEVFETVKRIKAKDYPDVQMNLVRMTFDKAVKKYQDKSIDILHIDRLHTYEGVKHDFDTWFEKVKDDGIILFHDTAVKKWGFGIYRLWDEEKRRYKTIAFQHSFGLGVLFMSPKAFAALHGKTAFLRMYYEAKAKKRQLQWDMNARMRKLEESPYMVVPLKGYRRAKAVLRL